MNISPNTLRQRYESLSDDDLASIYVSSDLTDEAREILVNEMKKRGITEKDLDYALKAALINARENVKAVAIIRYFRVIKFTVLALVFMIILFGSYF